MPQSSLIERIETIFRSLKSHEIIDILNQWNIDKLKLLSITIESKLGYDLLIGDVECKKFIDDIEESSVYSVAEYTQLIMFISTMGELNSRFNNDSAILNKFLIFHKMLFKTGSLVIKLLADSNSATVRQNNSMGSNPLVSNPMVTNPMTNQVKTQVPQTVFTEPTPSKVVTVDFGKIAAEQQNLRAQQEHEKLMQSKAEEIQKLEQELKSFRLPQHLQNIKPPVIQDNRVQYQQPQQYQQSYQSQQYQHPQTQQQTQTQQPQFTEEMPVLEKPISRTIEVEDRDGEMSLNNFLKSLALIDVPLESLS